MFSRQYHENGGVAGTFYQARANYELRRYHTRPLRINWGPENVHYGKTHFWDPNINVRIFMF